MKSGTFPEGRGARPFSGAETSDDAGGVDNSRAHHLRESQRPRAGALCALLLCFCAIVVQAHIGSSTVFYEGAAGAYQVRVSIQPPEVVPGRAQINVRVNNGLPTIITALPVRWDAGKKGAPPPDIAVPVKGETNLFSTELWLMDFGAYSVFVDVEGSLGKGTAIVPLNSVATQRLAMPAWMGAAFFAAGLGLIALLVIIIGAAARESALPPGIAADVTRARRGCYGMALGTLLLLAALMRGNAWWTEVDSNFKNNRLFKTDEIPAVVELRGSEQVLVVNLQDPDHGWHDRTPLIADHGKLMHLFLISTPDRNLFAHLHPVQVKPNIFEVPVSGYASGDYAVYADVTRESGLAQTYISKVHLPESSLGSEASDKPDPDNSAWSASANKVTSGETRDAPLSPFALLRSLTPPRVTAGEEITLRFDALASDGLALPLEPYLGMWSHAVILAKDGSVFTHIHPLGTISMASQEVFARRERGETVRKSVDVVCGRPERELTFPYAFPRPGEYRVWVQIKSNGRVLTGAFDFTVLSKKI